MPKGPVNRPAAPNNFNPTITEIRKPVSYTHLDVYKRQVRVYLDESENGTDGWWTLNYWTANAYNNSVATVSSGDYKITKGDYYRATGVHSVFQDDIVETTGTLSFIHI